MPKIRSILCPGALIACLQLSAQQQVTSMVTASNPASTLTYTGVKGAGQKNASGVVSSLWDSVGSSFTVKYFATGTATTLSQFTVAGHTQPFIAQPFTSFVRIRRQPTPFVSDTRNHFNFWSVYSSIPASGATTGTFNLLGPEVTAPELAFQSNNVYSGYDNIFQNTINNLHSGNIERVDFIVPAGAKVPRQYDADNAGVLVLDRGTGDPFKVAVVTALDANNDPQSFGPLVSVSAAQFGNDLLPATVSYCILIHDPVFGTTSRPSSSQTQNIRGVFLSFSNLGVTPGQMIYGYALFGQDVTAAVPDWTTYPNNSNFAAQLDPINVMSFFRDVTAVLPLSVEFDCTAQNGRALLQLRAFGDGVETVAVERATDGRSFEDIGSIDLSGPGNYEFTDPRPLPGVNYYRLRFGEGGRWRYSQTRTVRFGRDDALQLLPNPANEAAQVILPPNWVGRRLRLQLVGANGQPVWHSQYALGPASVRIPLMAVQNGIYYLRLKNEQTGEILVRSLAVLH